MSENTDHHFELVNDDFRITITAKCSDTLWANLIHDGAQRLSSPPIVITFDEKLTHTQVEQLRRDWQQRKARNG